MSWLLSIAVVLIVYFIFRRVVLESFEISRCGRHVFITGCDSGFGRRLALQLLSTGVHVHAGCYTEQGGEGLKKSAIEQKTKSAGELFIVPIDISSDESVQKARRIVENTLREKKTSLHGIVNNAGIFTTFGPDDWCTTEEFHISLNINTLGAIRVCHEFLPLVKESKGRVVTMGSTAGRLHGMYVAPYVTAKFAVEAYMDCLRLEMRTFGVSVHILEPGAFRTDLLNEEAQHARLNKIWSRLPAAVKEEYGEDYLHNFKHAWQSGVNYVANPNLDWVVGCYEHALFSIWPRLRYNPGWDAIFCFIPISILPTYVQDVILDFMYAMAPGGGSNLLPASLKKRKHQSLISTVSSIASAFRNQLGLLSFGIAYFALKSSVPFGSARATVAEKNYTTAITDN